MCGIFGVVYRDELPSTERPLTDTVDQRVLDTVGLNSAGFAEGSFAAHLAYYGLYNLQHRGQESAGIVASDLMKVRHGMGLVPQAIKQRHINKLEGRMATGHVRYSTTGVSARINIQPLIMDSKFGQIAIAHNGNILNQDELQRSIKGKLKTTTDTELVLHLIAESEEATLEDAVVDALKEVEGSFSLIVMNNDTMIGIRDSYENRPLHIAKFGKSYFLSSEDGVLQKLCRDANYEFTSEDYISTDKNLLIQGGDMVVIRDKAEFRKGVLPKKSRLAMCTVSDIYIRRQDCIDVGRFRYGCGDQLAREDTLDFSKIRYVFPIPNSGNIAADGYTEAVNEMCGLDTVKKRDGIIRNNYYVKRTFIEEYQRGRHIGTKMKYFGNLSLIEGWSVVVVDDSLIRNTTMENNIKLLRLYGADEVHIRIASPAYTVPCKLGIDTPKEEELFASTLSVDQRETYMRARFFGVDYEKPELMKMVKDGMSLDEIYAKSRIDNENYLSEKQVGEIKAERLSLRYLSLDGLRKVETDLGRNPLDYCHICFGEEAPVEMKPFLLPSSS